MTSDTHFRKPDHLQRPGCPEQIIACYGKMIKQHPDAPQVYNKMGNAYCQLRDYPRAVACFRRALEIQSDIAEIHNNLGNALASLADIAGAYRAYQQALVLKPDYAEAHNNLGNLYQNQGLINKAIASYHKALSIRPAYFNALNNLGSALLRQGKLSEAIENLSKALSIQPDLANSHSNLANAMVGAGRIDEALQHAQLALKLEPGRLAFASNFLMNLHYKADATNEVIFESSKSLFSKIDRPRPLHTRKLTFSRESGCLNLGFLSPDFCRHSVSFFFLPLLQSLDRRRIKMFCYSNVTRPDDLTRRISARTDRWCTITGLSDAQAAKIIAADGIDVLVDLAGHTSGNRLGVFAFRPAPVQISWLGYPGTTGLKSMDYRLTDAIADPPGLSDCYYSEKLLRLPQGFFCYSPIDETPPVADGPSLSNGWVTFGSFNNLPKMNGDVIALWAQLLRNTPGSRLLLKARQLADSVIRDQIHKQFNHLGIDPDRILLVPRLETTREHLKSYRHVDIALDPYPYNGTTTTCEALWMGVPVLTLCGNRHSARVGASILSRIGLSDLIADSQKTFLHIAARLAADQNQRQHLRQTLRQRMQSSPLCNSEAFAEQFSNLLFDLLAGGTAA